MTAASTQRGYRMLAVATAVVVAAGLAVRVGGLFTDFWIDEIWTLRWGLTSLSPLNLITVHRFKHDNNHLMNSLFIYLVGPQQNVIVYRLFALGCGIASLPLAWLLCRNHGRAAAALGLLLVAGSFQLVHYSSESRGYAPAVFFALLAWLLLERFFDGRRWYDAVGFWLAVACGFLSHLTFVYAQAGFIAMTVARLGVDSSGGGWRRRIVDFAAIHVVPIAFCYALWQEFVRPMRLGGGPQIGVAGAVLDYGSHLTGAPPTFAAAALLLVASLAAAAALRQGAAGWLLGGVLLSPVVMLAAREPRFLYARYFLICTPFILLVLARWMATWRTTAARAAGAALIAGWLVGQVRLTEQFVRHGRGHYSEAMAYVLKRSDGDVVHVASAWDRPFRDQLLVGFHGKAGRRRVVLVPGNAETEWLVRSSDDGLTPAEIDRFGRTYLHARTFSFAGLSGTPWHIYRAAPPSAPAASEGDAHAHR